MGGEDEGSMAGRLDVGEGAGEEESGGLGDETFVGGEDEGPRLE